MSQISTLETRPRTGENRVIVHKLPELPVPRVSVFYVAADVLPETFAYRFAKRVFDVLVTVMALVLLSPVFLAIALAIWFEDRGPIFYRQGRVGRYGVTIPFYKFRSMKVNADDLRDALLAQSDAEGVAFKMKNDPRVTKVGRFIRKYSLDELPQLACVLSGYMSIVGPRPLALSEGHACDEHQRARYLVKPGLVCLREIGGRSELSFEQWMDLDLQYVSNRSFWYDLSIFAKLIPAVLKARGAY